MSREFDVVIVGAGPVGSVMAGLLLARNLVSPGRVAVLAERMFPPSSKGAVATGAGVPWDLRVFALSRASQRVLQLCDVWRQLPRAARVPVRANVRVG